MKRTKLINQARIMRELWIRRKTTRVEVARALGLDKSTISTVIGELLEKGIIIETEEGSSGPQGGRKPVFITLNKHYGCVLGLEFRPESCTAVVVDIIGKVLATKTDKINLKEQSLDIILEEHLQSIINEIESEGKRLLGIGIGVSGVVDSERGIIKYSAPLGISSDFDFYQRVGNKFSVPMWIDNDANACVWGELAFHRRKELRDFVFLLLEFRDYEAHNTSDGNRISLGIGLVINGNVHYGHQNSAGEFRSLLRSEHSVGQFSLSGEEQRKILEDPTIMRNFLHELGAHVGLIFNTLNLSHIILGGSFEQLGEQVKEIFVSEIRKNWPYPYQYELQDAIWYSAFGEQSVAYGAAGMMLNGLFGDLEILEGSGTNGQLRKNLMIFSY